MKKTSDKENFISFLIFNYKNVRKIKTYGFMCTEKAVGDTKLGIFWILIRPLFPLLSFTIIFSSVAGIESGSIPYLLFVTCSFAIWSLLDDFIFWCTRSFGNNNYFIKNYNTPLLNVVIGGNSVGSIIFLTYLSYFILVWIYFFYIDKNYLLINFGGIIISIITFLFFSLSISIVTNILDLKMRDIRHSVKYIFNVLMFGSCVLYPIDYIPEKFRTIFFIVNPFVAPIINFRNSLFGTEEFLPSIFLIYSFSLSLLMLIAGVYFLYIKSEAILDLTK